ncbi:hypothetical protein MNB_SV-5-171 [hydrothermal vent metagenome]|uniref:DUF4878 domain-containing protein n=1 Tax=hydrothermal vent metagenome TaxID=652676 RepID=A0A1W1ECP3_9ZZZZ
MLDISSKIELHNQSAIVEYYYASIYSGDLQSVKEIMTERSYMMVLESYGLKLSLEDPVFREQLANIEESKVSLFEVEKKLSLELALRKKSPQIDILKLVPNGTKRHTVEYSEDGKAKKLHFSKKDGRWLIDYYAGRPIPPVSENYFTSMKNWVMAKLPVFHRDLLAS